MAEATKAEEFAGAFQEHMTRTNKRVQNLVDAFVVSPADPPMSSTPKDVVWKRGKTKLFRYRRQTDYVYPVPYVMVPWLGISRTHVLDLLPGNSFIEFLVKQGYDVYLLDWGDIDEEDKDLGFDEGSLNPRHVAPTGWRGHTHHREPGKHLVAVIA